MKTTLGEIMSFDPCGQEKGSNRGWDKLVSFLGTDDLDTEVTFRQILESNGLDDTLWALMTQDYRDYCLFLAEVAESVLYIFENERPNDDRPRKCIEGIRRYHSGEISYKDLEKLSEAVWDVMDEMDEMDEMDTRAAAWAARAASNAGNAVVSDAVWAVWAASNAVVSEAALAAASDKKLEEIEEILLKYI